MIYIILFVIAVLGCWFVGKLSKPGASLSGLVGVSAMLLGSVSNNLSIILFGLGLVGFSALVFLSFNGDNW